ncbi:C39 family peptidase, partial [Candidatus Micrarchaeota archaeon]|nr:C39 family peptidase [Candidatus Micrarchaeota archaeon]
MADFTTALASLSDYFVLLDSPVIQNLLLAFLTIIGGVILAKIIGGLINRFGRKLDFVESERMLRSFTRMVELFIVILSIIIALNFLQLGAAKDIIESLLDPLPKIVNLLLMLFLGVVLINLIADIIKGTLLRVGLSEYLDEAGISAGFLNNTFKMIKIFLFILLLSVSFRVVGLNIPFVDEMFSALVYGIVLLGIALIYFTFKEQVANFFAGIYLEKNLLKPGQHVIVRQESGEVMGVTPHGTILRLPTGYNLLVPNRDMINEWVYIKRTKQDINKLEAIRSKFVAQMPAYCGPASASMMLSFFGYETTQEQLGKLAGTRIPGVTGPRKLISAVRSVTSDAVKGTLVRYDDIGNLRDELKTWLSEGALVILWFNKPTLFHTSRGRGHYVVCVGVEGDELIIMDPSKSTAGVYLIDYVLFEEAMSEIDRKRGYIIFAKKGTPAYWRLSEGLVYADLSAYKELSKSFERYL